jgi:hypothetical protein
MDRSGSCLAIKRTGRKTIASFSRLGSALPDQPAGAILDGVRLRRGMLDELLANDLVARQIGRGP